jgi:hypothetical protein
MCFIVGDVALEDVGIGEDFAMNMESAQDFEGYEIQDQHSTHCLLLFRLFVGR